MADEEQDAPLTQTPLGHPADAQLLQFADTVWFSSTTPLQPGSKMGMTSVPVAFEVEAGKTDEGKPMLIYTFHTHIGAFRFTFTPGAGQIHIQQIAEQLNKIVAEAPLVLAKEIPRGMPRPGENGRGGPVPM